MELQAYRKHIEFIWHWLGFKFFNGQITEIMMLGVEAMVKVLQIQMELQIQLIHHCSYKHAGFSTSAYEGTGSNATIGHLGATPEMIMLKILMLLKMMVVMLTLFKGTWFNKFNKIKYAQRFIELKGSW